MSVIKDIQLNSSNLCNVECMDKNATVHPETCADQVLTTHSGAVTLTDWIDKNETTPESPYGSFDTFNSLHSWLETNYPINAETITLPVATTSTLGAIKVGQYLSIDNTGVLSVDKESLNIPEIPDIDIATTSDAGIVKLGSSTSIPIALNGNDYQTVSEGKIFPLKLDSNSRAGIFIPNAYHKVSWSEIDDANDYVRNNTLKINYGGQEYEFTSNGTTDTNIDIVPVGYSAGDGIDITNSVIAQTAATSSSLGGIKIGYPETNNKKAVKLDENNQAFIELKKASGAWVSNGMSQHYFRTTTATEHYIPLMKIEMPEGYSDSFKVNVLFRIVSRHAAHYSGTFYINIKNLSNVSSGAIIASDIVSDKVNTIPYLQPYDIVVSFDNEAQTSATVYRRKLAGTLGNASGEPNTTSDVFIVDILGNNAEDGNGNIINNITYYCTERFNDNEEVISSFATNITNSPKFNYIYNTGSSSSGVTSITAGVGLSGGTITETGTIKTKLDSETSIGEIGTTEQLYPVGVDINGKLCVNVPWEQPTYTAGSNISINNNVISATNTTYSAGTNVRFSGTTINVPTVNNVFFATFDDSTTSEYMDSLVESVKTTHAGNRTPTVYIDYKLDSGTDDTSLQCLAEFFSRLSDQSLAGSKIIIYVEVSYDTRVYASFKKAFIEHNVVVISGNTYECSANVIYNSNDNILSAYKDTTLKIELIVSADMGYPKIAFITTLKS